MKEFALSPSQMLLRPKNKNKRHRRAETTYLPSHRLRRPGKMETRTRSAHLDWTERHPACEPRTQVLRGPAYKSRAFCGVCLLVQLLACWLSYAVNCNTELSTAAFVFSFSDCVCRLRTRLLKERPQKWTGSFSGCLFSLCGQILCHQHKGHVQRWFVLIIIKQ